MKNANRLSLTLYSAVDGKDVMLSMGVTEHIDSYVEAFRVFLAAAAFPRQSIDEALTPGALRDAVGVDGLVKELEATPGGAAAVAEGRTWLAEQVTVKPPTQTLAVAGIDGARFGNVGNSGGVDTLVAARLNWLVAHPYFQLYATEITGTAPADAPDSVAFCVDFVLRTAFTPSADPSQPLKYNPSAYTALNQAFAAWAHARGMTLE